MKKCFKIILYILGFSLIAFASAQGSKPNIILMLADDAGFNDFGFQNQQAAYRKATPHIDSIAHDGMYFTQAYVSANVCAPSRAGLISGMYQERFGFRDNLPSHHGKPQAVWFTEGWKQIGLDTKIKTMGDYLKQLGYTTGLVGKWHLGYADHFAPHHRGFDYFKGIRAGSRSFFPLKELHDDVPPQRFHQREFNGTFLPENEIKHLTESQGDAALEFIDAARQHKNPFFLFLSFTAPHTPLQADPASLKKARELFPDETKKRLSYMGLIIGMDRQVGRVLDYLKDKKIEKNTLIVFLSDNGGSMKNQANNGALRGHKWTPFEGGYRVPLVIKWPAKIKAGSSYSEPVISLDLLPTFLNAAGAEAPQDLDGEALQAVFEGEKLDSRTFCWWDCNSEGLTSIAFDYPWKLVMREDAVRGSRQFKVKGGVEPWLFNLENDPSESLNLVVKYPEKVKQLKATFKKWVKQMEAPRW